MKTFRLLDSETHALIEIMNNGERVIRAQGSIAHCEKYKEEHKHYEIKEI